MNEIKKIIEQSLKDLYLNDGILINRFTKEEAINHWLAIHIDKHLKTDKLYFNCNVDVEYNRNVTDDFFDGNRRNNSKKIVRWSANGIKWKEIIPDIIVHERGSNENNYLCIEAKKEYRNNKSANKDFQKILGVLEMPYNYRYGCIIEYLPDEEYFYVIIIRKSNHDYEIEQFHVNKKNIQ